MMKFLKEKYSKLIVTFDLDAYSKVKSSMTSLMLNENKDYFKIGIDKGGKRAIEGLLPDNVFNKVWTGNSELVLQTQSDNDKEAKSAKNQLKKLYLEEFKKTSKPGNEHFAEFYKLTNTLNKSFKTK